jgi:hypothetical protein
MGNSRRLSDVFESVHSSYNSDRSSIDNMEVGEEDHSKTHEMMTYSTNSKDEETINPIEE